MTIFKYTKSEVKYLQISAGFINAYRYRQSDQIMNNEEEEENKSENTE